MADSPQINRSRGNTTDSPSTGRTRSGPIIVRPQQVTEPSLMESVAGFINEVQSYNQPQQDPKSQILWAKFEETDINDQSLFPQSQDINGNSLPLVLVLGYSHGIQVWCIQGSSEAQLVMSWFHGQVKCIKVLPSPETTNSFSDPFNPSRPIMAICDNSGAGTAFMSVSFISLATGEQVSTIKFNNEVVDILANKRVVCVAFREKVAVFSALNLQERFTLTSCYPCPGVHGNPLALHTRWLAYADKTLCPNRRSCGGLEGDVSQQSMTAWGINVTSRLASGMAKVCSNIFSSSPKSQMQGQPLEGERGIVTIVDTVTLHTSEDEDSNSQDLSTARQDSVVAHFVAHNKAIVALKFDPSGSLLLTADKPGNTFNIFRIIAHPLGSSYAAVHHLYSLYRGDTPGAVQDISFASDSRWVTVSTLRGTTHIFPICPYGGAVSVRTHTSHRVVNKLSRYHRSAGFQENVPTPSSGRNSPNPNLGSSPANKSFDFPPGTGGPLNLAYPCPYLPPYPSPTLIQPVAQLRQPYLVTITSSVALPTNRKSSASKKNSLPDENPIRVVAAFAPSRARMHPSSLHSTQGYRTSKRALDSLFVMANHGQLLEYSLEPTHDQTIPREKVCEGSAIELKVTAYGQWNLSKPAGKDRKEMTPPLASNNLLLLTRSLCKTQEEECWGSADEEDERWLSQVEILTHIGPARRLWMGPQFSFRPFQKPGEEDELKDLDVTVACRPRSDPVQMPGGGIMRHKPVYIECGSANSFELSPRFAPTTVRGSREQVHLDVEQEIREAMSDTVNFDLHPRGQGDLKGQGEEFFCISTEDVSKKGEEEVAGEGRGRGMAGEGRSRSGSNVSGSRSRHSSSTLYRGVEMMTAEGKIFSVAVSQGKSKQEQSFVYKDMDNQPTDRPVILSSNTKSGDNKNLLDDSDSEFLPVHRDPTAVLEHAADACTQNKNKLPSKVEAEEKSEVVLGEAEQELIQSEIQSAISQEEEKKPSDQPENKKKNKKKKGRAVEPPTNYSSADEVKEVETKARKKKGKNKDKEEEKKPAEAPKDLLDHDFPSLGDTSSVQQKESKQPLEACKASSPPASSSIKEDTPPPSSSSNNQKQNEKPKRTKKNSESDLLQFSSTAEVEEEDDEDDSKFFIRERSSSIDSELVESATRVNPYAAKPQESVWLENILKRGTSMIENQISGAVWKYEEDDDKNSCDEEMKECESGDRENGNGTEDHSPHLLQEEEVSPVEKALDTVADKLSELVTDDKDNAPASDDDFVPVTSSGKKNKKNKGKSAAVKDDDDMKSAVDDNAVKTAADDVTAAAAVEDMVTTVDDVSRKESTEKSSKIEEGMKSKDGWSFEVDEEDVNRLLFENATREDTKKDEGLSFSGVLLSNGPRPDQQGKGRGKGRGRGKVDDAGGQEEKQAPGSGSRSCRDSEERTALEDVFRFDSEMTETLDETETPASDKVIKGAKVSHEDLSDALKDETDSEAETGGRKCETTDEDMSCGESEKPVFSSSYPGTGTSSCSEGSVTNSPWATKTKGRKNKKKKR